MQLPKNVGARDAAALISHHRVNAINTHATLAERIWMTFRSLGVRQGRMLVHGIDAPVFTGGPRPPRLQDDTALVAQIPSRMPWPHEYLVPHPRTDQDEDGFDVVIANLPYSDVRLTSPDNRTWLLDRHEELILTSLAATLPGGIAAVITTQRVMDTEVSEARRRMLEIADLIGAVRLPSGSLREMDFTDHTDQVVDLLLFRRRETGEPVRSADFEAVVLIEFDGEIVVGNEYWALHPDHIIGRPGAYIGESGRTEMWVRHEGEALYDRLKSVTGRIIDAAKTRGLRATSRSWSTPQEQTVADAQLPRTAHGSRPPRTAQPEALDGSRPVPPRQTSGPGPSFEM